MSDPTGDSLDEKVGAALMTTHAGPHDYIAEVIALVRSEVEPEIREKVAQEIEPRPEITTLGGGSYGAGCIYGLRLAAAIIRGSR